MRPIEELFREVDRTLAEYEGAALTDHGWSPIQEDDAKHARAVLREIAERWPDLSSTPTDIEIIRDLNNQRRAILAELEEKR